jgi:5-methyltetrahydropteroyltriglutamate--homocysteine methyltransferase
MPIPTEPIGSIPRPPELIEAVREFQAGRLTKEKLGTLYEDALRDTIRGFEATGSPVISDGEQTKPSFATYPVHGLGNIAPDGTTVPFADGHVRRLPRLVSGPFRFKTYASSFLETARQFTKTPLKQAVISASLLSLLYPQEDIPDYSREKFLDDLVLEAVTDIRSCLNKKAFKVQIDFTEARLSLKLDPSGGLLQQFIGLNNRVLSQFSASEKLRIGVHTCPGGDQDATHSADVDYAGLLPSLFQLNAGNFYIQLASEKDRLRVLRLIREHSQADQKIFVGVIDPINPRIETSEEVRDRVLEAAEFIPLERLGSTDDCGFSPFGDDISTARDTAFEKIRARVVGTELAIKQLEPQRRATV